TSERSTGLPSTTARILSTTPASTTPARALTAPRRRARRRSERMADGEVEVIGALSRTTVELVAPVEAQRSHRAPVAQAEAGGVAQVGEGHVGHERVDVADVREGRPPEAAEEVAPQLDVTQQKSVAPVRPHLVHPEAPQRGVAAREEAV